MNEGLTTRLRLGLAIIVAGAMSGACGSNALPPPTYEEQRLAQIQAELDADVEIGLEIDLPRPMSYEQRELTEVIRYRQQIADDMGLRAQAGLAPVAVAAAFFAIDGPVDLMFSVIPLEKLGDAVDVARDAFRLRKRTHRSKRLITLQREFESHIAGREHEFMLLASALKTAERRALVVIYKRTGSQNTVHTLMRRHLDGDADVDWIADKIERGTLNSTFVRRFTFDKDIVEDITEYDAHISWRTLQDVVERRAVTQSERTDLARKVAGLMAERESKQVAAKVLMVNRMGYDAWDADNRNDFLAEIAGLGGPLDFIRPADITRFDTLVDSLR